MMNKPQVILVFSGKRKSGKDYITEMLQNRLGKDICVILKLSGPLKAQYAKEHNLDFNKLLDASEYKEKYRVAMIQWGEEKRNKDPGYFCHLTTSGPEASKAVWLISDARRKTDIAYFQENYTKVTKTARVQAQADARVKRGFVFTTGVDDAESECGLDEGIAWDIVISNNGDKMELENTIQKIFDDVHNALSADHL